MIEGTINAKHEAVMDIRIQGPDGRTLDIEAVVDTGFNGFLMVSPEVATELALPFVNMMRGILADGSWVDYPVHDATVLWDGQLIDVEADITGSTPLIGMLLLDGYRLTIDVEIGGGVFIQAKP